MLEIVCFIIKKHSDKYQNLYTSWIEAFKKTNKKKKIEKSSAHKKKLTKKCLNQKNIDEINIYDWQMIDFTQIFTVHNLYPI